MASGTSSGAKIRPLVPKDAASLVLTEMDGGAARILMGRRRADQAFLPNKWVFPGGRVERQDLAMAAVDAGEVDNLAALTALMKGKPSAERAALRARALCLTAIRETFEETGLFVGAWQPVNDARTITTAITSEWPTIASNGAAPAVSALKFFARAITPPGRVRRYDTRFFMAAATTVQYRSTAIDDEFSEIGWFTFSDAARLETAGITRLILKDAEAFFASGSTLPEVPLYNYRYKAFVRTVLG